MEHYRKEGGTTAKVCGRDTQSVFNSVDREVMEYLLHEYPDLKKWAKNFLHQGKFKIRLDKRIIGEARMTGGT